MPTSCDSGTGDKDLTLCFHPRECGGTGSSKAFFYLYYGFFTPSPTLSTQVYIICYGKNHITGAKRCSSWYHVYRSFNWTMVSIITFDCQRKHIMLLPFDYIWLAPQAVMAFAVTYDIKFCWYLSDLFYIHIVS